MLIALHRHGIDRLLFQHFRRRQNARPARVLWGDGPRCEAKRSLRVGVSCGIHTDLCFLPSARLLLRSFLSFSEAALQLSSASFSNLLTRLTRQTVSYKSIQKHQQGQTLLPSSPTRSPPAHPATYAQTPGSPSCLVPYPPSLFTRWRTPTLSFHSDRPKTSPCRGMASAARTRSTTIERRLT